VTLNVKSSGFNRILVTGGAGFIGSHLVEELVGKDYKTVILDDLLKSGLQNIKSLLDRGMLRLVKGDICNKEVVDEALQDVDGVFHLAAITSVPFSVEFPKLAFKVNVDGTKNLLEACLRHSVKRFIFASTCAVYGEPYYLPVEEKHPLVPISPYAESKLRAEIVCREFQETQGLGITILRPFNVYGPRQGMDQYAGVISKFIERLRQGKPPLIFGDGLQTRDFIFVKDVVNAFMLALKNKASVGRVFNVGTGLPTSINELADLLIELFGIYNVMPEYTNPREGDIKHSYAEIAQIRKSLGFEPHYSLREGLSILITALDSK
jgi:UDP-glucose 4-epimerase